MDISSKYFSLLRCPSLSWPKHFWNFLLDIRRVGKLRELLSFMLWEAKYRLRIYTIVNKCISFNSTPLFSITAEASLKDNRASSSSLNSRELELLPISVDWKYCLLMSDGTHCGSRFSHLNGLYLSFNQCQSAMLVYEFSHPITSLFISLQGYIFACAHGTVFKSSDRGRTFQAVLQLSTPISYFLFNNGMTELPNQTLLIGEYGSLWQGVQWQNLAFLYYSFDGGNTWTSSDFLKQQGVNKHIHLVKYCSKWQTIFLTDGDNKKQLWMNQTLNHVGQQSIKAEGGWRLVNKYHIQTGGYTSMAEIEEGVLFGSDYLGGTNFIVRTIDGKRFKKVVLPDPYRRSPIMNMVVRKTKMGIEIWAVSYSCLSSEAKSLLMYSKDSGKSWIRVVEFDGTQSEVRLVSSSQYPTNVLYISLTEFASPNSVHQVYRVV